MPHLSKKKIRAEVLLKLYTDMTECLLIKPTATARVSILNELLTETEKIMLAKRFALICMLGKGHTFEYIESVLQVSPSTIGRFQWNVESQKYKAIILELRTNPSVRNAIWKTIDFLLGGMPPKHGPRWKWLDEI